DFAAACNAALDAAATDWALRLNPDELVVPGGWPDLRGITPGVAAFAYRVKVRHAYREDSPDRVAVEPRVRLFRNPPGVRFLGRPRVRRARPADGRGGRRAVARIPPHRRTGPEPERGLPRPRADRRPGLVPGRTAGRLGGRRGAVRRRRLRGGGGGPVPAPRM